MGGGGGRVTVNDRTTKNEIWNALRATLLTKTGGTKVVVGGSSNFITLLGGDHQISGV